MKRIVDRLKNLKPMVRTKGSTKHILLTGDSATILKALPDKSIDLIFTDPPYNASLDYGSTYKDNLAWDDYYSQAKSWFKDYARILKDKGAIYLMNYPEVNARLLPFLEQDLGLKLKRWITWHYPTNIGHSKRNFTRSQRSILFLTRSDDYVFNRDKILQPFKNPTVGKIKERIKSGAKGRGAYDLLRFIDLLEMREVEGDFSPPDIHDVNLLKNVSHDRLNKKHPCQLPFELIRRFIEVSTNRGAVVLDPFAGTFSTSHVASVLGRNSIGVEINPKYVKLGLERLRS